MRVIYNTCFADPWIQIAQQLYDEYAYEPVYWNGYYDDGSSKLIPKHFPKAVYHQYYDAWKGIFPPEIAREFTTSYIDIDFIKEFAYYELQAIKMMDRMDPELYDFNFMERQRHFRNLVKYWTACIDFFKPDLVIQAHIPHRVYDYVLYLLCQFRKIKYICYRDAWPSFTDRAVPLTDIASVGDIFDAEYSRLLNSDIQVDELKEILSDEILTRYQKVQLDYEQGKPDFIKKFNANHKRSAGFLPLVRKFTSDLTSKKSKYFGKDGFFKKGMPTYYKQSGESIENSKSTVINYSTQKIRTNRYKKGLKEQYNAMVSEPDYSVPFVILNLHYQPEMSTCPCGDIFVDQRLCVEVLAKNLPSDYLIYVKEHPSQFFSHQEGHAGRMSEFYDDLAQYSQVRFMSLDADPFFLIRNSKAVVTVSGTVGWEGMVLGKPVIIFGLTWYEKYSGVLKVVDDATASEIAGFIEGFYFNEKDLLSYLSAFDKKSIRGYFYRGIKEQIDLSEVDCVRNICSSIINFTKNLKNSKK